MASDSTQPSRTIGEVSTTGLSVLVAPDCPKVDIVFVHGFTGHPERTWRHKGDITKTPRNQESQPDDRPSKSQKFRDSAKFIPSEGEAREPVYWPKDLLPKTVSDARVLTYGYDTHIRHRLATPISQNTVYGIANDFLIGLEAFRRPHASRPILFIAHSLGGIIVKEMLRQSHGYYSHSTHLRGISESTVGIIFFGTPHGGADPKGLLRYVVEAVGRIVGMRVNEQVLETLLPSSECLQELHDEFGPIAREKHWTIHCFQEQYGLEVLDGKKVVEDPASCLNDNSLNTAEHIGSNHMDMCRFSDLNDTEYEKVAAAVNRILANITENTTVTPAKSAVLSLDIAQRQMYVESMEFDQIDVRYSTIREAHLKTCKWLLSRPEYQDWLNPAKFLEHRGLLWIKGKPGTGKSTIMKFVLANAKNSMPEATIVSFFFNARGDRLEKSTLGMYRSLLTQVLQKLPDLQPVLDVLGAPVTTQSATQYNWHIETVKDIFHAAVKRLGRRRLICFIDALDECQDDDVRDMVSFVNNLGQELVASQTPFYVCFSSRHYPHITIEESIELILEGQEGHQQDITNYLHSELKIGQSKLAESIKEEILQRASGIFLWVVLVVRILREEYDRGGVHTLRQRLRDIPDGLHNLFRNIITTDGRDIEELLLCLQWILHTKRPLKREELYFALRVGIDADSVSEWDPVEITLDDMEKFILDSSKGLAELTKNQTVQFIHESVRDFLFQEHGIGPSQADVTNTFSTGASHERLKQCCVGYLKISYKDDLFKEEEPSDPGIQRGEDLHKSWPLLKYAVSNIFEHAEAACEGGILQDSFVKTLEPTADIHGMTFNRRMWIHMRNAFELRKYSSSASLLYIFAEKNLPGLIQTVLRQTPNMDIRGERYEFPMRAAIAHGNEAAVRAPLRPMSAQVPSPAGERDRTEMIDLLLDSKAKIATWIEDESILPWAILYDEGRLVNALVATGAVCLSLRHEVTKQVDLQFSLIVPESRLALIEVSIIHKPEDPCPYQSNLLPEREEVNRRRRLLFAAWMMSVAAGGRTDFMALPPQGLFRDDDLYDFLFTQRGISPNLADQKGRVLFAKISMKWSEPEASALLKHGEVDINIQDSSGMSPLWHALTGWRRGYELETIRLLLRQHGVDARCGTKTRYTLLRTAARALRVRVLRLLREVGYDKDGRRENINVLQTAEVHDDNNTLRSLLYQDSFMAGHVPWNDDVHFNGQIVETLVEQDHVKSDAQRLLDLLSQIRRPLPSQTPENSRAFILGA